MTPNPQTAAIEAAVAVWLDKITPEERVKALAALYERLRWRMEHGPS
jgi:hypothetical protein